ncbi:hypothetical protein [Paenibacillus sp. ISL-20]|uniref:hypothetical protein n=1 Tax=Paenibacillus sp. ISL-20 TaxID=2819163 RepID=UPI001BEC83F7|nr:hypothetical protein [Paenibacillus sp. ISL-20]MBT2762069.1 hypothetical protein [Paenibacillus sp. ISL-20]
MRRTRQNLIAKRPDILQIVVARQIGLCLIIHPDSNDLVIGDDQASATGDS